MKKAILLLTAILTVSTLAAHAQQNYIITTANDTLYGKVTRGNLRNSHVKLKNDKGSKKFHLREIKEWKNGDMPVIVLPDTTGKTNRRETWLELLVEVEGRARLFRDLYFTGNNIYYTQLNGKYIPITQKNIGGYIWDELSKCKLFREKYRTMYRKQVEQLYSGRNWRQLEEIFRYYNANCQIPTEPEFIFIINTRYSIAKQILPVENIAYFVRNGHLVREKHATSDDIRPGDHHVEKDSVIFGIEQYKKLKDYCIENWQPFYPDPGVCKHIPYISARLYFRDEEIEAGGYYGPCRAVDVPKEFLAAKEFLETFF